MTIPQKTKEEALPRPTISVIVMTRGPANRLIAILELFRPAVDEILVALDNRSAELAGELNEVADRVFLYPYREPVDRPLAWMHAQCSGDWVLTIADDEVPSKELLEALPRLTSATDVNSYFLFRRWLFPDSGHYLDEEPWSHDHLIRLVQNDARFLIFPHALHEPIETIGPRRYLGIPVYHADCILRSTSERQKKVLNYQKLRPGMKGEMGEFNEDFYLPERRSTLVTAEVPSEDLELIEAVLHYEGRPRTEAPATPVKIVTADEIDSYWSGLPLLDTDYQASIEILSERRNLLAGETYGLFVRLKNLSSRTWPWGNLCEPRIRLSYHWKNDLNQLVVWDGVRTDLPSSLRPGNCALVPLIVSAPQLEGKYTLEIALLHEKVRWFDPSVRTSFNVSISGYSRPPSSSLGDLEAITKTSPEAKSARTSGLRLRLLAKDILPPMLWRKLRVFRDRLRRNETRALGFKR